MNLQEKINELYEKNMSFSKENSELDERKPFVAIVKTNPDDEPSERYTKKKIELLNSYMCGAKAYSASNDEELIALLDHLNRNSLVTSIIVQAPLGKGITIKENVVFDLIKPSKDIDRLHSMWYYDKNYKNLPLTACGIYELINNSFEKGKKILFYGNGLTTNKRLFLKMFDEGVYDCRIINSKTPKTSKEELIEWSDIIVSSTGIPGILSCTNKYVISPTIAKTEEGFRGDLAHEFRDSNNVHNVLGGIGKLTTSLLVKRAFEDSKK
ncbi:MAG: tetrahydrofolate dehydrogenase/cyclohydrolase catalytic domain-containing protein [Paraclostridium sp.]